MDIFDAFDEELMSVFSVGGGPFFCVLCFNQRERLSFEVFFRGGTTMHVISDPTIVPTIILICMMYQVV
jgi:hypothetical protein